MHKEKVRELMQELDINEFVGDIIEDALEAKLDGELGYSKYDYCNKDTDNSRNGHSSKTMKTSLGEIDIGVSVTTREFEQ